MKQNKNYSVYAIAFSFALIFVCSPLCVAEATELSGREAMAIAVAVNAIKKIYAKPNLRHYTTEVQRHGEEIEVTFLPDQPEKVDATHGGTAGGATAYGPEVHYFVSSESLRILRLEFAK